MPFSSSPHLQVGADPGDRSRPRVAAVAKVEHEAGSPTTSRPNRVGAVSLWRRNFSTSLSKCTGTVLISEPLAKTVRVGRHAITTSARAHSGLQLLSNAFRPFLISASTAASALSWSKSPAAFRFLTSSSNRLRCSSGVRGFFRFVASGPRTSSLIGQPLADDAPQHLVGCDPHHCSRALRRLL